MPSWEGHWGCQVKAEVEMGEHKTAEGLRTSTSPRTRKSGTIQGHNEGIRVVTATGSHSGRALFWCLMGMGRQRN